MDIRKIAQDFYLDYFNNYLTVAKIAEHNQISEALADALIEFGRKVQNGEA